MQYMGLVEERLKLERKIHRYQKEKESIKSYASDKIHNIHQFLNEQKEEHDLSSYSKEEGSRV